MNNEVLVSICCITYNHAPYIRQCLDGFMMQQTNFAFEVLIHDDASTDGTADIIREYELRYPNIIKPIFQKENQFSKGVRVGMFNYSRAQGKYIAMCEGDDYWIDPFKLQKQVDFLNNHEEYDLVHTYFDFVDINSNVIPPPSRFYKNLRSRIKNGYIWHYYLIDPGFILTCTTLIRSNIIKENGEETFFDHGLFMKVARKGKVFCIKEITSCYRRNPNGAMMSASSYYAKLCDIARLRQLEYFFDTNFYTNTFYKKSLLTYRNICIIYTHFIINIICGKIEGKYKKNIFNLFKRKPLLLCSIPLGFSFIILRKINRLFSK